MVVLSPGTAAVAIEVKSSLDSNEIPKAYSNICSVKRIDPAVLGLVFGYDGVAAGTFVKHVTTWDRREGAHARGLWPDRVFNLEQKFVVAPDPAAVAASGHVVAAEDDPIVRLFLTAALTKLGLSNLRPFMRADKTGPELHKI